MLFSLSLMPANPTEVKHWLRWAWGTTIVTGAVSIGTLVESLRRLFPEQILSRLPNYEDYFYMALAFALISSLPLLAWARVVTLQLTKLGLATGLLYLGFSLSGVFLPRFRPAFYLLVAAVAFVFLLIFYTEVRFYWHEKSWSDVVLKLCLLVVFVVPWIYLFTSLPPVR